MFILIIAIKYVLNFLRTIAIIGLMLPGKDHLGLVARQAATIIEQIIVIIAKQLLVYLLIIVPPAIVTALAAIADIKQRLVIVLK